MQHPLLTPRRKPWALILLALAVVSAGGLWTAVWYYAAAQTESRIQDWRQREANAGRIQSCGKQTVGGFPFRIIVRCTNAAVEVRSQQPPLLMKAKEVVVVAQIHDPARIAGEVVGPFTVSEPTRVLYTGSWSRGRLDVHGVAARFERLALQFEEMRIEQPGPTLLMSANRLELNGRLVGGRPFENPVLDITGQATGTIVPGLGPIGEKPGEADFTAVLHGLRTLAPRPAQALLRELQASGGRLEIASLRLQQGDMIAVGAGMLALSASGRPEGILRVTATGVERLVQTLGLDRALAQTTAQRGGALGMERTSQLHNALDRIMPGLSTVARGKAMEAGVQMGLALLGEPTQLEGRRAVAMPLRFADGQTTLGPIRLGQVPPLY